MMSEITDYGADFSRKGLGSVLNTSKVACVRSATEHEIKVLEFVDHVSCARRDRKDSKLL